MQSAPCPEKGKKERASERDSVCLWRVNLIQVRRATKKYVYLPPAFAFTLSKSGKSPSMEPVSGLGKRRTDASACCRSTEALNVLACSILAKCGISTCMRQAQWSGQGRQQRLVVYAQYQSRVCMHITRLNTGSGLVSVDSRDIYVHAYTHMHSCIHAFMHTYTHTYTHTYKQNT